MSNVECRRNDKIRMSKMRIVPLPFEHSGFFRHSSFVLRHSIHSRLPRRSEAEAGVSRATSKMRQLLITPAGLVLSRVAILRAWLFGGLQVATVTARF